MGDIADDMIDEGFDQMLDDWFDFYSRRECSPSSVTCRQCGQHGLHWKWKDGRYQLYQGAARHRCKPEDVHANVIGDFDVLPDP
ncbi:MAG: hypothetical protein CMN57_10455 [Gammaproteobacteria bacterium]|nr:hypothetical protein [Gammaproteobacteria bacterium]